MAKRSQDFLKLQLPSRLTLHRYSGMGKNVTGLIKSRLEAEVKSLQPIERVCSLVTDGN
jgi:hypothetical protein